MSENAVKVALIDQAEDYRKRLASAFEKSGAFRIVHESASVAGLCEAVQASSPDVLLFDPACPQDIDSLRAIDDLRAHPATAKQTVAVLTAHRDAGFISRAIGRGRAAAYITKDESPERIMHYLQCLQAGGGLVLAVGRGYSFAGDDNEWLDFRGVRGLTATQLSIADMLDAGLKPKEIAARTGPSIATIYRHVHNIKEAIGFRRYDGPLLFEVYLRRYLRACRRQ